MTNLFTRASRSIHRRWQHTLGNLNLERLNIQVAEHAQVDPAAAPVVFFNASTRLQGLSLNAAYSLIASWAVRLAGVPVIHFACQGGMARCVLGTNRERPSDLPPCPGCISQSRANYAQSEARWFVYRPQADLETVISHLGTADLASFEWKSVPLGSLVLPSVRWILRRHTLCDDEPTRFLFRQYILSAFRVVDEFEQLLDAAQPQAVVVFNGMFFPEASARWAAQKRGLRVISHEVGLQPYTAFFTSGDATAYPIHIPDSFELSAAQNERLDAYLSERMQGNFSMAGVRFWPEMRTLDEAFLSKASQYRQIVPVFTNVIFDTSQPHSNVVFEHMFAWLESVVSLAKDHPETLFVIRAHPDEARPGKESRESVAEWIERQKVRELPNVVFVRPQEFISSYELISRAKFVMVYNSTIGLEAALMGAPVLCAGKARFTQLPTVFFPQAPADYLARAQEFLNAEHIEIPPAFQGNARRFLYYQLYRTSLPFDALIEEDGIWKGYVRFKDLDYQAFDPGNERGPAARVLRVLVDGIISGKEFLLEE